MSRSALFVRHPPVADALWGMNRSIHLFVSANWVYPNKGIKTLIEMKGTMDKLKGGYEGYQDYRGRGKTPQTSQMSHRKTYNYK
jgi:hypothetical protein